MGYGLTTKLEQLTAEFLGTPPAWQAIAGQANFYIELHTGDPAAGTQSTLETIYTSYTRVTVIRTAAGWLVAGVTAANVAQILFPACTGPADDVTLTHTSFGLSTTGIAGQIIRCGALLVPKRVINGIQPYFDVGDFIASFA
jgi:hypothetical protein